MVMSIEQDSEPRRDIAEGQDAASNTLASVLLKDWKPQGTSSTSHSRMPQMTERSEPLSPPNVGIHEAPVEPSLKRAIR